MLHEGKKFFASHKIDSFQGIYSISRFVLEIICKKTLKNKVSYRQNVVRKKEIGCLEQNWLILRLIFYIAIRFENNLKIQKIEFKKYRLILLLQNKDIIKCLETVQRLTIELQMSSNFIIELYNYVDTFHHTKTAMEN